MKTTINREKETKKSLKKEKLFSDDHIVETIIARLKSSHELGYLVDIKN